MKYSRISSQRWRLNYNDCYVHKKTVQDAHIYDLDWFSCLNTNTCTCSYYNLKISILVHTALNLILQYSETVHCRRQFELTDKMVDITFDNTFPHVKVTRWNWSGSRNKGRISMADWMIRDWTCQNKICAVRLHLYEKLKSASVCLSVIYAFTNFGQVFGECRGNPQTGQSNVYPKGTNSQYNYKKIL